MDEHEFQIMRAVEQTKVVRAPRRPLATFGVTNTHYYLVTQPSYQELVQGSHPPEAVVREGKVIAEQPVVVTPQYMANLEGFGDNARKYLETLAHRYGPNTPGLLYRYRNESGTLNIAGGEVQAVSQHIIDDLERKGDQESAVIQGVDDLWDVSLLKFIYEFTAGSLRANIADLGSRGLLDPEPGMGIPRAALHRIEELFRAVEEGADPTLLKQELDRWELFERYEDRFLGLFRRRFR